MTLIKGKLHVHTNVPAHPAWDGDWDNLPRYSTRNVEFPSVVMVANPETVLMDKYELAHNRWGEVRETRLERDIKQIPAQGFSFLLLDILKPGATPFGFTVALILTPEGEKLAAWLKPGQWKPLLQGED